MRIVVPTADYPPIEGGISTVTVQVSRELARLGHEVVVVAPWFEGQADFDAAEPVTVVRYRGYYLSWLRFIPMLIATWRMLKDADLLLGINISYGGVIGRLAKWVFGTRYVTFAYAYEFLKFPKWSPPAWLIRGAYCKANAVIAISHFAKEQLNGFGVAADLIHVVHPGAPTVRQLSEEALADIRYRYVLESGPVILAVGRFIPRKGQITLVRAMPNILARVPDAQLVLVGQGPCMAEAIRETHEFGIREHVTFPGRLSDADVAGLYQVCDVFALPTGQDRRGQAEGFGLVFSEAHAYGKPVVAGRSGGVVDAVLDGETGLIVEPNDPDALADALVRVLGDTELAHRLGDNGRQRVESELNWARFSEKLIDIVERAS